MRERILEDLFLLALLGIVIYILWDRLADAAAAIKDQAAALWAPVSGAIETTKTALSPIEAARNLFTIVTSPDYISQADFRANIEKIKANLKGQPVL